MIIKDKEKERKIPIEVRVYNTFFKRLKGLMFEKSIKEDLAFLLEPCDSIHMFFMRFSIDVLFLNGKNEIIFLKENVKPWTIIRPKKNAYKVLEMKNGTISKYDFKQNQQIEF